LTFLVLRFVSLFRKIKICHLTTPELLPGYLVGELSVQVTAALDLIPIKKAAKLQKKLL